MVNIKPRTRDCYVWCRCEISRGAQFVQKAIIQLVVPGLDLAAAAGFRVVVIAHFRMFARDLSISVRTRWQCLGCWYSEVGAIYSEIRRLCHSLTLVAAADIPGGNVVML